MRVLDASAARTILLVAPPGYGKTTLLREWLQGRDNVVWYCASPASADVAGFCLGLCDAIAPIVPAARTRLRQRLRVGDADKIAPSLAEVLAASLAAWPPDAQLVLDDYHVAAHSAAVEEFVGRLTELAPARLAVASRRRPGWATGRRVLYGEIVELGRDELAMTDAEARQVLGPARANGARRLLSEAQGWPALLRLAAVAASTNVPPARVRGALFRYFAEEILRQEEPEGQRFLLDASVPPALDAGVARELLGIAHAQPSLQRLKDDGLLQDSRDGELVFHPLLRAFLRETLRSAEPKRFEKLVVSAITDARRRRRWEDAFELAVDAGRLRDASEIIGDSAPELLAAGRVETLRRWLSRCDGIQAGPATMLAQADILTRTGRLREAQAMALAAATSPGLDDGRGSRAWHVAARASHLLSEEHRALEYARRALETATSPADAALAAWAALIVAAELEHEDLDRYLDELAGAVSSDLEGRVRIVLGRKIRGFYSQSFEGLQGLFDSLLPLAEDVEDPMLRSNFVANAAYLAWARADYARAERLASRALDLCDDLKLPFVVTGVSLFHRGAAAIGLCRFTDARATIDKLAAVAHDDPYLRLARSILEHKLVLSGGAGTPIRAEPVDADVVPRAVLGEHLALSALYATGENEERARELAREARATTRGIEAWFYSRFAELVVAMRSGLDERGAAQLIQEAVRAEFADAVVVACRVEPMLLEAVDASQPTLRRVVEAVTRQRAAAPRNEGVTLLTERERQILGMLTEGASNGEIAARLSISQNTVKVHVHHILEKLDVRSRLQAVVKAQRVLDFPVRSE
jgi:LuxR family maltose regulon positive regulatory protein